jgi:hypothetical protein
MPPYDLVRHLDAFGAALRAGAPYAFEHRLAGRPDNEWYLTQAAPVCAGGELVWFGTTAPVAAPAALPRLAGLRLEAVADPDAAARGVWYDAFTRDDGRLVLSVGQVAGPAPAGQAPAGAGGVVALLRGAVRGAALAGAAPDLILAAADGVLTRAEPGRSATALLALYDARTGLLDYAGAGHPPALLHDGTRAGALVGVPRPPLGRPAQAGAEVRTARLRPGFRLLLHAGGPLGTGGPAADPGAAWETLLAARAGAPGGAVILLLGRDLDGPGQA